MASLADELILHTDAIVQRWYEAWQRSPHQHPELPAAALKDRLPRQLRMIGEQLRALSSAESPHAMWKSPELLDPEARVEQDFPIEEVVQEYRVVVDTIRGWVADHGVDVTVPESSYFFAAIFELTAESVRRYAAHQIELIRKDRAEYLASVMHQLRTPLASLAMQTELLHHADGQLDARAIAKLERNVRRITVLVDGVLRLERFQPWELPVRPEEHYVARLVEDVMSDYRTQAERKGLRFEAHVDQELRLTVDPDLFVDTLGNLVQNAVKYTSQGYIFVEVEEHAEDVIFCVRDSGPGIPPEKLQTLFKELQPAKSGGVGLGLRIAQRAAEAQGGSMDVKSEVGKGSVFSVRLPRVIRARYASSEVPST